MLDPPPTPNWAFAAVIKEQIINISM